jgi:hypothetical protein
MPNVTDEAEHRSGKWPAAPREVPWYAEKQVYPRSIVLPNVLNHAYMVDRPVNGEASNQCLERTCWQGRHEHASSTETSLTHRTSYTTLDMQYSDYHTTLNHGPTSPRADLARVSSQSQNGQQQPATLGILLLTPGLATARKGSNTGHGAAAEVP